MCFVSLYTNEIMIQSLCYILFKYAEDAALMCLLVKEGRLQVCRDPPTLVQRHWCTRDKFRKIQKNNGMEHKTGPLFATCDK